VMPLKIANEKIQ